MKEVTLNVPSILGCSWLLGVCMHPNIMNVYAPTKSELCGLEGSSVKSTSSCRGLGPRAHIGPVRSFGPRS